MGRKEHGERGEGADAGLVLRFFALWFFALYAFFVAIVVWVRVGSGGNGRERKQRAQKTEAEREGCVGGRGFSRGCPRARRVVSARPSSVGYSPSARLNSTGRWSLAVRTASHGSPTIRARTPSPASPHSAGDTSAWSKREYTASRS